MRARLFLHLLLTLALVSAVTPVGRGEVLGAEKVVIGLPVQVITYSLPVMAAEKGGFWKQNNLEAEHIAFRGGGDMTRAVLIGAVTAGFTGSVSGIQAISRGLSLIMVGELFTRHPWRLLVHPDNPMKDTKELKGKSIGVSSLLDQEHGLVRASLKKLGFKEKEDVKIVAMGGVPTKIAALKAKAVDAIIASPSSTMGLEVRGELRKFLELADYLPENWTEIDVIVHKDLLKNRPDTGKRVIRAIVQGLNFIRENPAWNQEQIKSVTEWPDAAVQEVYRQFTRLYSKDGRLTFNALDGVRNFMIDGGIITAGEVRPTDSLYTDELFR